MQDNTRGIAPFEARPGRDLNPAFLVRRPEARDSSFGPCVFEGNPRLTNASNCDVVETKARRDSDRTEFFYYGQ
jgi:hypothetical protein